MSNLNLNRELLTPFGIVAAVWLLVSVGLVLALHFGGNEARAGVLYVLALWTVCLLDLFALARTVGAVLAISAGGSEKRGPSIIQAFYWATIKLACLGILGFILFRGNSMPASSLYMGSATLVVVPLFGGYWWSQKVLRHAS